MYYLLFENWMFLIPKNLNPLYPRMLCAKFDWPIDSEEEDFFNFVNVFLLFHLYLPLAKGVTLHLINYIYISFEMLD